jgi:hypothetical protein
MIIARADILLGLYFFEGRHAVEVFLVFFDSNRRI